MRCLRQIVHSLPGCQTVPAPVDSFRQHTLVLNTALDLIRPKSKLILETFSCASN
jgi:hypothetical protein